MPWFAKVGDKRVNCDDLPMEVYARIQSETGVSWYELLDNPMRHSAAGPALLRAAAESIGATAPDPVTPRVLVDSFTPHDADLPTLYDEGGLPNSEGAQTTD